MQKPPEEPSRSLRVDEVIDFGALRSKGQDEAHAAFAHIPEPKQPVRKQSESKQPEATMPESMLREAAAQDAPVVVETPAPIAKPAANDVECPAQKAARDNTQDRGENESEEWCVRYKQSFAAAAGE